MMAVIPITIPRIVSDDRDLFVVNPVSDVLNKWRRVMKNSCFNCNIFYPYIKRNRQDMKSAGGCKKEEVKEQG